MVISGNSWGICKNGVGGFGCGQQEVFRGCADISIIWFAFYSDILEV